MDMRLFDEYVKYTLRKLSRNPNIVDDTDSATEAWERWASSEPSINKKRYKERLDSWDKPDTGFYNVRTKERFKTYNPHTFSRWVPFFQTYYDEVLKESGIVPGHEEHAYSNTSNTKKENNHMTNLFNTTKANAVETFPSVLKGAAANSAVKAIIRPVLVKLFVSKHNKPALISKSKYEAKVSAYVDTFMDSVFFDLVASVILQAAAEFKVPGVSKELAQVSQEVAFTKIALSMNFDKLIEQFADKMSNLGE